MIELKRVVLMSLIALSGFSGVTAASQSASAYPNPPSQSFPAPISRYDAQRLVQVLYQAILFRNASSSEIAYGANLIASQDEYGLQELGIQLATSEEFVQNIDSRYSSDEIVVNFYRVFFGRYPDAPKPWTVSDLLDQGQASQAVVALLQSAEFRNRQLHRR
jgi:TorA maturation chaperone TorD